MVTADKAIPLGQLSSGQLGYIEQLRGQPAHVRRLEEFGLRPGVQVQMIRPGKCFVIRLGGTKVCLRPDPRTSILVRPHNGASQSGFHCPVPVGDTP